MPAMSLDKILTDLDAVTTKTAAAPAPKAETQKVAQAKTELVDALKRAETASTKTASEKTASPVAQLEKVAADLAAADAEAIVKEAGMYGAAIADGFMARLQQYEAASNDLPAAKTASAQDTEKIATEAVLGYIETQRAIKVAAEQEFQRGYAETMARAEKVASDVFGQGAQDCANVLRALAK